MEGDKLLYKYCRGYVSQGIVLQLLGDIIALVLDKQSTTIADGFGNVLVIYRQSTLEGHA